MRSVHINKSALLSPAAPHGARHASKESRRRYLARGGHRHEKPAIASLLIFLRARVCIV